jgi:hypothetical protein
LVRLLALRPLLAYCASLGVIVKMIVEKQMECRLAGETNRSSRRKPTPALLLFITKSHMTRPGFEPGPPRWKPATNRLTYGAANFYSFFPCRFESRWGWFFFNLPTPSIRSIALGSTQPLTEMSTRNL